jgi:hypothetical protein
MIDKLRLAKTATTAFEWLDIPELRRSLERVASAGAATAGAAASFFLFCVWTGKSAFPLLEKNK